MRIYLVKLIRHSVWSVSKMQRIASSNSLTQQQYCSRSTDKPNIKYSAEFKVFSLSQPNEITVNGAHFVLFIICGWKIRWKRKNQANSKLYHFMILYSFALWIAQVAKNCRKTTIKLDFFPSLLCCCYGNHFASSSSFPTWNDCITGLSLFAIISFKKKKCLSIVSWLLATAPEFQVNLLLRTMNSCS